MTYTFLLRHAASLRPGDFDVAIDDRSDSYDKRDEVMEIVSNRMLRNLQADSSISRVTKNDSKLLPGLQVGIRADHLLDARRRLGPHIEIRTPAKPGPARAQLKSPTTNREEA